MEKVIKPQLFKFIIITPTLDLKRHCVSPRFVFHHGKRDENHVWGLDNKCVLLLFPSMNPAQNNDSANLFVIPLTIY